MQKANVEGWAPSSNSVNTGIGNHGSCCAEMDIWEANSISTALTPHAADTPQQTMCTGDTCGGTCRSHIPGELFPLSHSVGFRLCSIFQCLRNVLLLGKTEIRMLTPRSWIQIPLPATPVPLIQMAATSTPTAWETQPSTALR